MRTLSSDYYFGTFKGLKLIVMGPYIKKAISMIFDVTWLVSYIVCVVAKCDISYDIFLAKPI